MKQTKEHVEILVAEIAAAKQMCGGKTVLDSMVPTIKQHLKAASAFIPVVSKPTLPNNTTALLKDIHAHDRTDGTRIQSQ